MATKKCGVYSIYCQKNGKRYIGSSNNIIIRWQNHRHLLRYNKSGHRLLQEEWNLYGEKEFVFSILEFCQQENLTVREDYWCEYYKANFKNLGYNISSVKKKECKEGRNEAKKREYIKRIGQGGLEVIVINKDTGEVVEYPSCIDISEKLQIPYKKIWDLLNYWKELKGERKSYRNWILVKKEEYNPNFDYIGYRKIRDKKESIPRVLKTAEERNVKRVPIILENEKTGEYLELDSIREAIVNFEMNKQKIYKCLKSEYKKYKHKGYFIKYK